LMGFRGAPQAHRAPHDATVFHRPLFVDRSVDARKAFRPVRAIEHQNASSVPRTRTAFCPRLHSVGRSIELIVSWFRDHRRLSVPEQLGDRHGQH
jgi:hypothetical protein